MSSAFLSESEAEAIERLLKKHVYRNLGVAVAGPLIRPASGVPPAIRRLAELEDGRCVFLKLDPENSEQEAKNLEFLHSTPLTGSIPVLYGYAPDASLIIEEGFRNFTTLRQLVHSGSPDLVQVFTAYLDRAETCLYMPTLEPGAFELDAIVQRTNERIEELLTPDWQQLHLNGQELDLTAALDMQWKLEGHRYPPPLRVWEIVSATMMDLTAPFSVFGLGDANPDNAFILGQPTPGRLIFCDFASASRTAYEWDAARKRGGVLIYPAIQAAREGIAKIPVDLRPGPPVEFAYSLDCPASSSYLASVVEDVTARTASQWTDIHWRQRMACCEVAALLGAVRYQRRHPEIALVLIAEALKAALYVLR